MISLPQSNNNIIGKKYILEEFYIHEHWSFHSMMHSRPWSSPVHGPHCTVYISAWCTSVYSPLKPTAHSSAVSVCSIPVHGTLQCSSPPPRLSMVRGPLPTTVQSPPVHGHCSPRSIPVNAPVQFTQVQFSR